MKAHAWKLTRAARADAHQIPPTHSRSTTSHNIETRRRVPVNDGVCPGFDGVCDTVLTQNLNALRAIRIDVRPHALHYRPPGLQRHEDPNARLRLRRRLAAPAPAGCLDQRLRGAHFGRLTVRTVRPGIGRHGRTMFLSGCVDDAATALSGSSRRWRASPCAHRDRRRVCRELLEQFRCATTHTGELLFQRVAVHPARGFRLHAPGDSAELPGKCQHPFLQPVHPVSVPGEVVGAVLESRRVALGLRLVICLHRF
jgi:hypothetical protein